MTAAILSFLLHYAAGPAVGAAVGYWVKSVLAAKVVAEYEHVIGWLQAEKGILSLKLHHATTANTPKATTVAAPAAPVTGSSVASTGPLPATATQK